MKPVFKNRELVLEITIGIVLLVIVGILFYESFNPVYRGFGQPEFPPMRFPRWMLLGIAGLSIIHLLRTLIGRVTTDPVFFDTLWLRVLLAAIFSLLGVYLFKPLGFTLSAIITLLSVAILLGYRNYFRLALITVLFVLGCWGVFTFLIKIGLPTSPFLNRI